MSMWDEGPQAEQDRLDENFINDDRWAQDKAGAGVMRFLEILWANGNAGVAYPAKAPLSKAQKKAADELFLVEVVKETHGHVWRFTSTGARFANRYFPEVQRRKWPRWWIVMSSNCVPVEQREVVILTDHVARMLVLAEVISDDAKFQLKASIGNLGASDRVTGLLRELLDEIWKE